MTNIERFLLEGAAPAKSVLLSIPDPWRERALQAGLAVRWRRFHERVRQNLDGFPVAPHPCTAASLLGQLAECMARVTSQDLAAAAAGLTPSMAASEDLLAVAGAALRAGRGLVVITARFGYWQAALRHLARLAPVSLLHPRTLQPFQMEASGPGGRHLARCNPGGDRMSGALKALGRNEIVAVLQDVPRRSGPWEPVPLLGRKVRVSAAAAVLSQLGAAPGMAVLSPFRAGGPVATFADPIEPGGEGRGRSLVQAMARFLDAAVSEHPEQWLGWLQRWCEPVPAGSPRPAVVRGAALLAGAC